MITAPLQVPAAVAAYPQALPSCCVRHGSPATVWKPVTFDSRPPLWAYLTLVLGLLPAVIVLMAMRRQIRVPAWPVCRRCLQLRRQRLLLSAGAAASCFAVSVVAVGVGGFGHAIGLIGLISAVFVTPFVALAAASSAGWSSIADGFTSRDGLFVVLPRQAPSFVAGVTAPPAPRAW